VVENGSGIAAIVIVMKLFIFKGKLPVNLMQQCDGMI
jgi:hypothetical protein